MCRAHPEVGFGVTIGAATVLSIESGVDLSRDAQIYETARQVRRQHHDERDQGYVDRHAADESQCLHVCKRIEAGTCRELLI